MEIERVINAKQYTSGSKFVGMGFTAKCYLLKDGRLLKLYYKSSPNKNRLFKRHENDMIDFLNELSKLDTKTYVAPKEILINENDEIIGYFMDYKKARTLKYMKRNVTIDDIIKAIPQVVEDTEYVSSLNYHIFDMHLRNILFDDSFYIIDLDGGFFREPLIDPNSVYDSNMKDIGSIIVDAIFKNNDHETRLEFFDQRLREYYLDIISVKRPDNIIEFLNELKEVLKNNNPTIKEIRKNSNKVLRKEAVEHYYGY